MEKDLLVKTRKIFEDAGIERYTVEFNNNIVIPVGFEGYHTEFRDDIDCIVVMAPKKSTRSAFIDVEDSCMEVAVYSYTEVQAFRAGVGFKPAMKFIDSANVKNKEAATNIVKKLCRGSRLYPIQSYPDKDSEGRPQMYGGLPSAKPGVY